MPKEERQVDLKTGRVRRKALFEEEEKENDDAESDEEDEEGEAMSEDESDGDDEDDAEEESDRKLLGEEMAVGRAKRLKTEVAKEEAVNELPAFADSDDDLEMSSEGEEEKTVPEENDMEEDEEDEEEEEEDEEERTYEDESSGSEFEAASKRVAESKQSEINSEDTEMKPQISDHRLKRKAVFTTDSGNCTAEEASESEVENSSLDEANDEEGSRDELEVESNKKGFQHAQAKKADSISQTKLEAIEAEDDDVENLLREEDEYEEKIDFSADTTGRL